MKNFLIFIAAIFLFIFSICNSNLFTKTRHGVRQESFESLPTKNLPPILLHYLTERHAKYEYYKIPNYVIDLLSENRDFKSVYKIKPKYTILIFAPADNSKGHDSFKFFYDSLKSELNSYPQYFDVLYRKENKQKNVYLNTYDNSAYKDLAEYCKMFCIIDPSRNTLFTFKRYTNSETDSLSALLQQYAFMMK